MIKKQALTMIITSIAIEGNAFGRVIDAEGDKLQYVLDRCQEICVNPDIPKDILEVNNSVTRPGCLEAVCP